MPTLEYWIDSSIALTRWQPRLTDTELWHSFENLKMMLNDRDDRVNLLIVVDEVDMPPQLLIQARKAGCFELPNLGRIVIVTPPHQIPQLVKVLSPIASRRVMFYPTITEALDYFHGLAAAA